VNEYVNLEQIRNTVVASVDGREIRVGDLGEVRRSNKDREIQTRTSGQESVQLDVYKEADANMVALADRVRIASANWTWSANARLRAARRSTSRGRSCSGSQVGEEAPRAGPRGWGARPSRPTSTDPRARC